MDLNDQSGQASAHSGFLQSQFPWLRHPKASTYINALPEDRSPLHGVDKLSADEARHWIEDNTEYEHVGWFDEDWDVSVEGRYQQYFAWAINTVSYLHARKYLPYWYYSCLVNHVLDVGRVVLPQIAARASRRIPRDGTAAVGCDEDTHTETPERVEESVGHEADQPTPVQRDEDCDDKLLPLSCKHNSALRWHLVHERMVKPANQYTVEAEASSQSRKRSWDEFHKDA
ncbi:hypothetical protein OC834_006666 [Tilletia horrida]|nr:hypothetical protein OC834_006666 [Tilletia horrida]